MQISDTYDAATGEGNFTTVASGTRQDYVGTTITKKFDTAEGRYIKLIVKGTSGGNFSVLAEIDAGVQSQTQRVIAPTSSKLYTSKAWKDSKTVENEPNGYLIAEKKNSKAVVRFTGNSFALYAATGEGYGSFKVKLDGEEVSTVSLDSEIHESRKLVFIAEQLNEKEHTVEIITLNSSKVMLNVIGIPYTAELINAPNIYLEHNLTVALIVFVVLFAALLALVLCLTFIPKFRNFVFGNKVMKKYDDKAEQKSAKRKAAKAAQPEKAEGGEKDEKSGKAKIDPNEIVAQNLKARAAERQAQSARPALTATSAPRPATSASTVRPTQQASRPAQSPHHAATHSAPQHSSLSRQTAKPAPAAHSAAKPEKRVMPPNKK